MSATSPTSSTTTPSPTSPTTSLHVVVIVLGDIGRSPRMQYHAQSLLQHGHTVSLVGYHGEKLIPALQREVDGLDSDNDDNNANNDDNNNTNNNKHLMGTLNVVRFSIPSTPRVVSKILPLYLLWRITAMCFYVCYALFIAVPSGLKNITTAKKKANRKNNTSTTQNQQQQANSNDDNNDNTTTTTTTTTTANDNNNSNKLVDCILVQNPPAVPLLAIVYFYCVCQGLFYRSRNRHSHGQRQRRPAMIIDWHNLGFTMLSKTSPIFASVARMYEQIMAPKATAHLCVTNAMKSFLVQQFGIDAQTISVVHDCPNSLFQPQSIQDHHELFQRLHTQLCSGCPRSWYEQLDSSRQQTLFTEIDEKGEYRPRIGRPALVTSSTSWTPDEDFDPLLVALIKLDQRISSSSSNSSSSNSSSSSLKVMVIVTGKGPRKSYYQQQISFLKLQHVCIQTVWLEPEDYPRLLACADVGISLHTSTSGIDLPMKILDLFGCQTPVCAINFQCLSELVQDDVNGRIFETATQLEQQLWTLLSPLATYPGAWSPHGFGDLARYSRSLQGRKRWDEEWDTNAKPVIESSSAAAAVS